MAKVRRRVVARGDFCTVECAVREDEVTSPASAFLDHLAQGTWVEDPDLVDVPDDVQIGHRYKLGSWLKLLADDGIPPYQRSVNYLVDGIWEYKLGARRLSFYDTPGNGIYVAKPKINDGSDADYTDDFWWFPKFDSTIRLGWAFPKLGDRARDEDIDMCMKIREEDLSHDK